MSKRPCSITGCTSPHLAKGYCNMHYGRWKNNGDPLKTKIKSTPGGEPMKYFLKALGSETEDCIEWPYSREIHGYGRMWYKGKLEKVSRVMMLLKYGPPPEDKPWVLHSCNNPPCFNYRHLRYGNIQDNMKDMTDSNHSTRGERHPNAKLTANQVLEIRQDTRPHKVIAEQYGIHHKHVALLKMEKSWKHI